MKRFALQRRSAALAATVVAAAGLVACTTPWPQQPPATTTTTQVTTTSEESTTTTEEPTTTSTSTTTTTEEPTTTSTSTTTSTTSTTTTTSTTSTSTTTTTTLPAAPVHTPVSLTCQASAIGQTSVSDMESGVTTLAPSSVASGSTFQVELTADPIEVPTEAGGFSLRRLSNVQVRFQVPAGATFLSATLSGGSNLGSGTPSVSSSSGIVTLSVPGPLSPGTTAVLPKVTATLQATGAPGTVLPARLAGNSYGNPSISFTAVVRVLFSDVSAPTNCYAPSNPVLATTTIS